MSTKRHRSTSPAPSSDKKARHASTTGTADDQPSISEPIDDRQSRFMAYYHPDLAPRKLQQLPECASASHRILAWRRAQRPSKSTLNTKNDVKDTQSPNASTGLAKTAPKTAPKTATLLDSGHDDDGEKHAGRKVLQVLESSNLTGSILVARWYGGIMLGPVRFAHIENCARGAIDAYRRREAEIVRQEQERIREKELRVELSDRDASISALRGLVEQKSKSASHEGLASETPKTQSSQKIDYEAFQLDKLNALSAARDRTIEFLLKKLDSLDKTGHLQ